MDVAGAIAEEPNLLESLAALGRRPLPDTPVLFAKVKLLWQCNLACRYCTRPLPREPMPAATVRDLLGRLAARGLRKVHFSGGEVFLHPELWTILASSVEAGLQVNLTTNGTLLDGAAARRLSELGVHAVSISLDGPDAALHDELRGRKGAFKATVKAIRAILRRGRKGPRLRVNTVVTSANVARLDELHALLRSLGEEIRWRLLPVDGERGLRLDADAAAALVQRARGWTLLERPPFVGDARRVAKHVPRGEYALGHYKARRCYVPWLGLFVDPEGFAYPCCAARGKTRALGRIGAAPVEEILGGEGARALRMSMAAGHPLDACRRCDDFLDENRSIEAMIEARRAADAAAGGRDT